METFFHELGCETVISPDTNRFILNQGVKYCVDEACLPVKVFHGHVCWLRDKCDAILIPRIMSVKKREYICPKFCGITEMIANNIPDLPRLLGDPIYWESPEKLLQWALNSGRPVTSDKHKIKKALDEAVNRQNSESLSARPDKRQFRVALLGHPYNIYDPFINMNLIEKLNRLGVDILTEEFVDDQLIEEEVNKLYKKPFWTFVRSSYGAAVSMSVHGNIDGIIYISSFACGIDSVILELISRKTADLPLLVLKIDEHTGEAGFNTRIEAFTDMLGRRIKIDHNNSSHGQCVSGRKSIV